MRIDRRQRAGRALPPVSRRDRSVDAGDSFEHLVARLSLCLHGIVEMRFVEQLHQREIAARLGISPVQVSRLLRRALHQSRAARPVDAPIGGSAIAS